MLRRNEVEVYRVIVREEKRKRVRTNKWLPVKNHHLVQRSAELIGELMIFNFYNYYYC